ncbi:hypothetical protein HRR99_03155 [Agrobacterium vaccinii]|uniref:hypothetical protein n=1 Tax=Agrobacterium vaccinii TaxID=2735528 RepID=UPI001E2BBF21|nr:hypothetical protein [Agrobacterium vaccinii]UHS60587.1 hypothetical protein HRR99_03155 [Agrobacterium vaccinii]
MIRQTSTHKPTISKTENREISMSTLEMFSPELARDYGRKMLEMESRGNGDQLNALERIGRVVGLKPRAVRRILNGETQPTLSVFARLRSGYLDLCERQINRLQHEVATEKARFGDAAFAGLDQEIQALAEKIHRAKEGQPNG